MSTWSTADVPRLDGETIVVTGANSGLGFEATRVFAARGAEVVMACRSTDRGNRARRTIAAHDPDGEVHVRKCDLGDLSVVASFADGLREEFDGVDILCNNAGVMAVPRQETADGFELQFGVNHLGHFALTARLFDLLVAGDGESRVVTHASGVHERGEIAFEDLHGEQSYDRWEAYAQSKLANVLFAYELQRRLGDAGIENVASLACHPGWAATNLQQRTAEGYGSRIAMGAMKAANAVFAQPAEQGALPMLYAATEPGVTGGSYVGPSGLLNMRGAPEPQRSSDRSYDQTTARRLWEVSSGLTGVSYERLEPTPTASD